MKPFLYAFCIGLSLFMIASCGQKGPLYLPQPEHKELKHEVKIH